MEDNPKDKDPVATIEEISKRRTHGWNTPGKPWPENRVIIGYLPQMGSGCCGSHDHI